MFRRDEHDQDVEDEVSQFRRQAESFDDDEQPWNRDATPPWERQDPDPAVESTQTPFEHSGPLNAPGVSVVSAESTWTGTLASEGPIEIYGTLSGELVAAGNVFIASGAEVKARIQAVNLTVAGRFQGSVACTNRFEVLESGQVDGDVLAPTIVVHDGAQVVGEFRMRDDEPDEPGSQEQDDNS